jgi:hypothetical protein
MDMASKGLRLLAVLAVAWAAALPGTASAGGWDIDPQGGKFPLAFTITGGQAKWTTASTQFVCTSVTGTGRYETATTGSLELTLHACAAPGPFYCTTKGQPLGTITSTEMQFHNVFLEPGKEKPGILITAKEELYAAFDCPGFSAKFSGKGLISEMATPKCGETSNTSTQLFEPASLSNQKWMQVETEGTKYDLSWTLGGTAAFQSTTTLTLAEQATVTC